MKYYRPIAAIAITASFIWLYYYIEGLKHAVYKTHILSVVSILAKDEGPKYYNDLPNLGHNSRSDKMVNYSKAIWLINRDPKKHRKEFLRAYGGLASTYRSQSSYYNHKKVMLDGIKVARENYGENCDEVRQIYSELFNSASQSGKTNEAENYNDLILKMKPQTGAAFLDRGSRRIAKYEYTKAIKDFDEVIKLEPKNIQAYSMRAAAYSLNGDKDKSLADLAVAIKLEPANISRLILRGRMLNEKGEYQKAIDDFDSVIRLDSKNIQAYHMRSYSYGKLGDNKKKIDDLNTALKVQPKYEWTLKARGRAYYQMGKHKEAAADFLKSKNTDPSNKFDAILLFLSQRRSGVSQSDARDLLQKFANKKWTNKKADNKKWPTPIINLLLGKITADEALAAAAVPGDPKKDKENKCEAYFYIGQWYMIQGDKKKGLEYMKLCLEHNIPNFVEPPMAREELKHAEKAKDE